MPPASWPSAWSTRKTAEFPRFQFPGSSEFTLLPLHRPKCGEEFGESASPWPSSLSTLTSARVFLRLCASSEASKPQASQSSKVFFGTWQRSVGGVCRMLRNERSAPVQNAHTSFVVKFNKKPFSNFLLSNFVFLYFFATLEAFALTASRAPVNPREW